MHAALAAEFALRRGSSARRCPFGDAGLRAYARPGLSHARRSLAIAARSSGMPAPVRAEVASISGKAAGCLASAADGRGDALGQLGRRPRRPW